MITNTWVIDLGPRKRKAADELLAALRREGQTHAELNGRMGQPETERTSVYWSPMGGANRPDVAEAIDGLKRQFANIEGVPVINEKNLADFIEAGMKALQALQLTRPVKDARISLEQQAEQAARMAEQAEKRQASEDKAVRCWRVLDSLKPANATAVIVAELMSDDSDSMTDYYASHSTRKVAIGWRTGSREDFRQLRAAAATFEPTADYGPGCDRYNVHAVYNQDQDGHFKGSYWPIGDLHGKRFSTEAKAQEAIAASTERLPEWVSLEISKTSIEHRENYSMGSGNYLGNSKYSGWIVKSYDMKYNGYRSDVFETEHLEALALMQKEAKEQRAPQGWDSVETDPGEGPSVRENDEKDGLELRFPTKPAAEILAKVKAAGWRWSRFSNCWYTKRTSSARQFAQSIVEGAR